ncbi:glycoside hydrolase family 16 protein [Aulographum hederae CBS 113979]|uniref:chitinase n=1 Tax=Aulographum hederae CBS 113979 TaxID=1176131 RepID=A0A6G1GMK5_9PEZI|nr:glycoside hydrolase family 16 protein [Aulographum hederae CBS 113979]
MHFQTLALGLAAAAVSSAQTWSACDPTKKAGCPTKPALPTEEYAIDFKKGAPSQGWFNSTGAPTYGPNGATFTIKKVGDGPTIQSNFYIFFGYVEIKLRAAPSKGIVSTMVMQSDNLDEIDWEFIGSDTGHGQTNFFGKGNTTTYDRGWAYPITTPASVYHTYAVDWTAEKITWFVNGAPIRTVKYGDASALGGKNFPQTPMNIRIRNWVAGTPGNAQGVINWAGGLADFSNANTKYEMMVEYVKVKKLQPLWLLQVRRQ